MTGATDKNNIRAFIVERILVFMVAFGCWLHLALFAFSKNRIKFLRSIATGLFSLCIGTYYAPSEFSRTRLTTFGCLIRKLFAAILALRGVLSIVNGLHLSSMLMVFERHTYMKAPMIPLFQGEKLCLL